MLVCVGRDERDREQERGGRRDRERDRHKNSGRDMEAERRRGSRSARARAWEEETPQNRGSGDTPYARRTGEMDL